ncbi:amidohydrolase family protein [Mycobacterium xenopi 4042]|uniref:Amidohydrolase family protein n=1 Tax=Mycobacterium xenopi 4042 TaxID=1299334 RepID=X8BJ33_MYCXE|nr:amidohydrolase family protein [Mycobacterium xenopi 4042]
MLIQRANTLDGATVDVRVGARIEEVAGELAPRARGNVRRRGWNRAARTARPPRPPVLGGGRGRLGAAGPRRCATATGWPARCQCPVGSDGWIRRSATTIRWPPAGPNAARRHLAAGAGARTAPERRAVDPQLGGLTRVGLADHPDGRLRSADPSWSDALGTAHQPGRAQPPLARYGVTGVTDATPDLDVADIVTLTELHRAGIAPTRALPVAGKRILHDDDLDLDALPAGSPSATVPAVRSLSTV